MSDLRNAVRIAIAKGWIRPYDGTKNGVRADLARLYGVTRQRVSQIVKQEFAGGVKANGRPRKQVKA